MNELEIFILAFALSIDAMLVSFSYGLCASGKKLINSLLFALSFGFFQFFMPLIGAYLTGFFYSKLQIYSKWIVFFIFLILGLKFIKNAFDEKKEEHCISVTFLCLMWLSLATSIDALGAGVSLKMSNTNLLSSSSQIGIMTFILSFTGYNAACLLKKFPCRFLEIFGGILLVILSVKALI